uniref:Uncharacterized protein n=1 Tax=Brassica oleracea var. oleracea TaxID=109376 RepID=A0A0D3BEM2_BRAOL
MDLSNLPYVVTGSISPSLLKSGSHHYQDLASSSLGCAPEENFDIAEMCHRCYEPEVEAEADAVQNKMAEARGGGGAKLLKTAVFRRLIDSDTSSKEDIDVRLKWIGGKFMMRLSNGVTTSAHTRYLANVIREYGEDGCDNKTDWQICGVVLPNVPEILKGHAVLVRFIVM